jgi:hypothetical protein
MLLCSVAAMIGSIAATLPPLALRTGRAGLLAVLAAGQWAGHEALAGLIGHGHAGNPALGTSWAAPAFALSGQAMLLTHAVAVLLCALLLAAAERLYAVVSRAVRAVVSRPRPPAPASVPARWPGDPDRPPRFLLLGAIAARAPPVPA